MRLRKDFDRGVVFERVEKNDFFLSFFLSFSRARADFSSHLSLYIYIYLSLHVGRLYVHRAYLCLCLCLFRACAMMRVVLPRPELRETICGAGEHTVRVAGRRYW